MFPDKGRTQTKVLSASPRTITTLSGSAPGYYAANSSGYNSGFSGFPSADSFFDSDVPFMLPERITVRSLFQSDSDFDQLSSMVGRYHKLYRKYASESTQWKTAMLVSVSKNASGMYTDDMFVEAEFEAYGDY